MTPSVEEQARQEADKFRRTYRLGVQPLGDLVAFIEQTTGYDVAILDADPDEHGLAMRDPIGGAIFVGIARSRNPMRQRSTLAHELGHLVFEDWNATAESAERSPEEIRADAFARHLLVPAEGVEEFLGKQELVTEADLAAVVQRFLVSPSIAAIAMRDAGYVNQPTALKWRGYRTPQLATRYGWSDHYASLQDDSDRLRAPQSLVARAVAGYAEGVVSAQVVATLRGVSVDAVLEDFDEAGIVEVQHTATDVNLEDLPDVEVDLSDLEGGGASS